MLKYIYAQFISSFWRISEASGQKKYFGGIAMALSSNLENLKTLTIHDIAAARAFGQTDEEIIFFDAQRRLIQIENEFDRMLHEWHDGNKPQLTLGEAAEKDREYRLEKARLYNNAPENFWDVGRAISFTKIANGDVSIALYSPIPFIADWASSVLQGVQA